MKQKIKILPVVLIAALVAFLGLKVHSKIETKAEVKHRIEKLPAFSFVQMDGRKYSKDSVRHAQSIVMMYFDPECSHCQYMTTQIVKNINDLSAAQIIMVTNTDSIAVKHFVSDYHLAALKNIVVLCDPHSDFYKIWGSAVTPSFFIYKNGLLVKSFQGETKIENLAAAIR